MCPALSIIFYVFDMYVHRSLARKVRELYCNDEDVDQLYRCLVVRTSFRQMSRVHCQLSHSIWWKVSGLPEIPRVTLLQPATKVGIVLPQFQSRTNVV